jgi:hypothetical protein
MTYGCQSRPVDGVVVGDEGLGSSPVVQGVEMIGPPCHLGPDILAAQVQLARITAHFPYDKGSAQDQCVMEQVIVLPSTSFDVAVGDFSFGPAVVYRQVAKAELAQLPLLHLVQTLPGRHLLEHLAFRGGMPLLASLSDHARESSYSFWIKFPGRREVHLLVSC